jgi:carbon storage regulator
MLVLTRRNRESVFVGGARTQGELVKVTVLEVRGGKVRLGFEAPDDVSVHRWEVWQRIRSEIGCKAHVCR